MPRLGLQMREGTVVAFRARLGDRLERGAPVVVIESDKAEVELEAPAPGVLRHIYVEPGGTVPCGTLLAALTESADEEFDADALRALAALPAPPRVGADAERTAAPSMASLLAQRRAPQAEGASRAAPAVTPAARRRARELGIDPARIAGSGPGGRVTREDLEALAQSLGSRAPVAPGVRLEVLESGSGEPVLLLPGFGSDASVFARQIPAIAQRFRARALNPRGVGLSDPGERDLYDLETAVADAAAVAGEACVHVVGASFGAAAALGLVLKAPLRVRSLTLVSPFLRPSPRLLAVVDAWCAVAAAASSQTLARSILPWLFSCEFLSDAGRRERAVRAFAESAERAPAPTLRRAAEGLRRFRPFAGEALAGISAPTLVIAGGADLLAPDAAALAARIPAAKLLVLQGVGHAAMLEAPDDVNRELLQHLEAAAGVRHG